MKKFLLLFISFSFFINMDAQVNLVPNGSFEMYDTCPHGGGYIFYAIPWTDPTNATADYFNSCSASGFGVPNNGDGIQYAKDGNAYAGFIIYYGSISNLREYIQVQLTDTLQSNICYRLIFYVSIPESSKYGVNTISAYFSSSAVSACTYCFLPYTPQFTYYNSPVIGDDTTWYKVEGTFVASGGERFMTIGNFMNDANTSVTVVNPGNGHGDWAYFYIDDISLIDCDSVNVGIPETTNPNEELQLIPNPASSQLQIINNKEIKEIKIYNFIGEEMQQLTINNNQSTINITQFPNGIYFIQATTSQSTTRKKFIKQ